MSEGPLNSDERTRAADLFEAHAGSLSSLLARRFPGVDAQVVSDVVVGAVLHVSAHFERYDPSHGSLRAFLYGVARRLLAVRLRSEERRRLREQEKSACPVTSAAGGGQTPVDELADRELAEWVRAWLGLTPEEDRVLDLWLLGEKETGVYAAALGLADRPQEEQAVAVGRALNRLRQRLHRARLRLRQEGSAR